MTWAEAPADPTETIDVVGDATAFVIRNDRDEAVDVALTALGSRGTTATVLEDLGTIQLEGGAEAEVALDLSPFLEGSVPYARSAMIEARASDPADDELLEIALSLPVYFHEVPVLGGVIAYEQSVLMETFDGGDYLGVAGLVPDAEARVERVLQWEAAPVEGLVAGDGEDPEPSQAAGPGLTAPPDPQAGAYTYELCVKLKIDGSDSGFENGDDETEDVWPDINAPSEVTAHGIKVKIGGVRYDAAANGCLSFSNAFVYYNTNVVVYSRSTLSNGTYIRMHDGAGDTTNSFPGSEYTRNVTSVLFTSGQTTTIEVGLYNARWTAMAAFAKSIQRYNGGLPANSEFHVSDQYNCDVTDTCDCSANYNYHVDPTNNEAYIRMVPPWAEVGGNSCGAGSLRLKFVVAHEYGHAYGKLIGNVADHSPSSDLYATGPSDCPFGRNDEDPTDPISYNNETKEFSSVAAREGWAHFVSARVWNDKDDNGQFRWNTSFDLERWATPDSSGGYLTNTCCVAGVTTHQGGTATQANCDLSFDGAGTIPDWMRGFWELHAHSCSDAPTRAEMGDIYGTVISGPFLTNTNFSALVSDVVDDYPGCSMAWDNTIAPWNGLDE